MSDMLSTRRLALAGSIGPVLVALAAIGVPIVIIATLFLGGAVKQAGGIIGIISLLVVFGWYELLGVSLLRNPLRGASVLSM
jgi:hypothetical protein